MGLKPDTGILFFLAFSTLMFLHILFTFCGFYGNDDINYSRYAARLISGEKMSGDISSHYSLRWTCIYATAFFYQLFGINEITSALFSFFCLTGTAFLIKKLISSNREPVLLYAYILFFFSFTAVFYAHRLLPDTGICFFVFLAYYFYHKTRFKDSSGLWMAMGFSLSLFMAMLTKESIIVTLPLWLYFFINDVYRRQRISFWMYAAGISLALLSSYLLYWKITTGDWLYRYHALLENHLSGGGITYQTAGMPALIKRLTYELWEAFLLNGDFEYLIFGIGAFIYRKSVFENKAQRHIAVSLIILLLCANFMTYSLNGYNPLLPDPRHYMYLLPFAAVSGGYMIKAYLKHPEKYTGLILMFVIADIFLIFSDIGFTKYVYLLITVILLLYRITYHYKKISFSNPRLAVIALALIMGLNYINDFIRPRYPYYFDQKKLVKDFVKENRKAIVFAADDMTAEISEFMSGYKYPGIRFIAAGREISPGFADADRYLLINGDYNHQFNINTGEILSVFEAGDADMVKKENNVTLYKLNIP